MLPTLALLVGHSFAQAAFPDPIFISMFPVTHDAKAKRGTVEIVTRVLDKKYGELTRRKAAKALPEGHFVASSALYPKSKDRSRPSDLACTFLVDCDEASVKEAAAKVRADLGDHPRMDALASWTGRFISHKDLGHDFDLASTVARDRAGDCTEHAVLLAALARSHKIPARVVIGLVILDIGNHPSAMGHAWVEWHDAKGWHPADAALTPEEMKKANLPAGARLIYLPVEVLGREDAGFHAALIDSVGVREITSVILPLPSAAGGD